jgi:DNA repair exonuclease SbcCD nuclease subunit
VAKFIHTADLHVGKSRTLPDYLERQELMLDGIFKAAESNGTKTVLMAGDIFESKNIRWSEQKAFMERLFAHDALGHTTVLCNGNHDELVTGVSHMWLPSLINDFGGLANTTIVDGESRLVKLPDMHIGVIPVVHNNMSTKDLSDAVAKLYEKASDELPFVMMIHATITGCTTDTGVSLSGGPRIPKDCGFVDYWALGDIHKSQQMSDKAWYSGAPIQHDFGDIQPKGVLVVTVEKGEEPQVELVELEGIKPLVTLTEAPEEWPSNCYIRYLGPLEGIIDLPENVVKADGVVSVDDDGEEPQTVQVEFSDSVTEGLSEYLHSKGITRELQEEAVKWVQEKYVK